MGASEIGGEVLTPKREGTPELSEIRPGVLLEITQYMPAGAALKDGWGLIQSKPFPRGGGGFSVLMLHVRNGDHIQHADWSLARLNSYDLAELGITPSPDGNYDQEYSCRRISMD